MFYPTLILDMRIKRSRLIYHNNIDKKYDKITNNMSKLF